MISEEEAKQHAALPKWGEPCAAWTQDRNHPHCVFNSFGVLDREGATLSGLTVEFEVFRPPKLAVERYKLTLNRHEYGVPARIYQLDINRNPRYTAKDHAYSHEHLGTTRTPADPSWAMLAFPEALVRFCLLCNLTLTEPVPHFDELQLR